MQSAIMHAGTRRPRIQARVLLASLLLIFPMLALLIFEQGRVISSQRILIQQLAHDSMELGHMKMRQSEQQNKSTGAKPAQEAEQNAVPQEQPRANAKPPRKGQKQDGVRRPVPPSQPRGWQIDTSGRWAI